MRNIIFISLLGASAAFAGDETPLGCFERVYSDQHLAKNPNQIVKALKLNVFVHPTYNETQALMSVEFANQGRVKGQKSAGKTLDQTLYCYTETGPFRCGVDCDGGSLTVTRYSGGSLTFETQYLTVGETDSCGGAEDLAETTWTPVKYKLNRVDDAICNGM